MKTEPICYTICPSNPAAHRFEISCCVESPNLSGQSFALPAWIPGSYLIRDFARHITHIRAELAGRRIPLDKIDTHTWKTPPLKPNQALRLSYEVYAWDLSVRGAHLDETHAFFNGTSVFLRVLGQEDRPCVVDIQAPVGEGFKAWRVATTLPAERAKKRHSFGVYRAENYAELIDHPVEMGHFSAAQFAACGTPHEIVITGQHDCDLLRLTSDLKRLCEWQIRFFGEPAPMPRYLFLITAVGDGYGGLEHRASTALLCARNDLPHRNMQEPSDGYRRLLGLCSHEYFHAWNVKRIMPNRFTSYDLSRENHTTLLWFFEGFTSYYDDLALLRSGLIALEDWLKLTAKSITQLQRTPGRHVQTLAAASFDAWSKFYKADENTANVGVSYYLKGALVGLALDLHLRIASAGKISLDDVMRALWQNYGQRGIGVGEGEIQREAEQLLGHSLAPFFADAIDGTKDLPLKKLLAPFGITLKWHAEKHPSFGTKYENARGELKLSTVYDGGPAQLAGLAAGDVVLALNGVRASPCSFDATLARYRAGDCLKVHAFRRDELMIFNVCLGAPANDQAELVPTSRANRLRKDWLRA